MAHDPPSEHEASDDEQDTMQAKQRRFVANKDDLARPDAARPLTRKFPISKPLGRMTDPDLLKRHPL